MLGNLNIVQAIRALMGTVVTASTALNRTATLVDKTLQLAENKIDYEIADQKATYDQLETKRAARVAKKVAAHDEAWELDAPVKPPKALAAPKKAKAKKAKSTAAVS